MSIYIYTYMSLHIYIYIHVYIYKGISRVCSKRNPPRVPGRKEHAKVLALATEPMTTTKDCMAKAMDFPTNPWRPRPSQQFCINFASVGLSAGERATEAKCIQTSWLGHGLHWLGSPWPAGGGHGVCVHACIYMYVQMHTCDMCMQLYTHVD